LRALAIAAASRSMLLPDVPTTAEAGLPGYEASQWYGIFAPARLPPPLLQKFSAELKRVIELPATRQKLATQGADVMIETPAQFAAYLKQALVETAKLAAAAGVRPE